jgi:hypothetical protein
MAGYLPNAQQLLTTDPRVGDRVQAVSALWVDRLDLSLAKAVMDTCEPKTLDFESVQGAGLR